MVVVLMVERAPRGLRGELSRWLLEPRAGVFVGNVSAEVREKLWDKVCGEPPPVAALLVHGAQTEQRFRIRAHGDPSRELVDCEGLTLVKLPSEREHKRV